jgi:hypothetical protein
VADGQRLAFFLQPYQSYDVRLRPRGGLLANFDTAPRRVTLFPGNVARLDWKFRPLFIMFGRAVGLDGKPLVRTEISGGHGLGQSDENGYFQIETSNGDELKFSGGGGSPCMIAVGQARPDNGYFRAGDVLCR